MSRDEFLERVQAATLDFMAGLTASEAAQKHGISVASIRRRCRALGLRLSDEEIRRRKARGGAKTQRENPHVRSQPCPPGCTCNRHKPPNNKKHPIIMGRKNCGKCGRWLSILDFDPRQRDVEGNALAWQTTCKSCMRERCRIYAGIKRRGKPYNPRRQRMSPEEYREHRRRRYHELKQDPEWWERRKEYMRIYAEAKRREQGIEPRFVMIERRKSQQPVREDPKFPIEPFQQWIRERADFYARVEGLTARPGDVAGLSHLADLCKISDRTLRRFLDGFEFTHKGERREITHVGLGTVDQCLTNEGSTFMWELYEDSEYMMDDALLVAA